MGTLRSAVRDSIFQPSGCYVVWELLTQFFLLQFKDLLQPQLHLLSFFFNFCHTLNLWDFSSQPEIEPRATEMKMLSPNHWIAWEFPPSAFLNCFPFSIFSTLFLFFLLSFVSINSFCYLYWFCCPNGIAYFLYLQYFYFSFRVSSGGYVSLQKVHMSWSRH